MFEKYFDSVIEQVYEKVTKSEENIVMACYNNSFSVEGLDTIKRYSNTEDNVFFAWKEFSAKEIVGAYAPFLDVVCEMYRTYIHGDFDEFLTECQVYELQRDILKSYYETGICLRQEEVLLDEVPYEQSRLTKTIVLMLKKVAEQKPLMLVINRFQLASKSAIELIHLLLQEGTQNIGIVLGVNEARLRKDSRTGAWNQMAELLEDLGQVYHIGSSGRARSLRYGEPAEMARDLEKDFAQLKNAMALLDYEQANIYLQDMERGIKYEGYMMAEDAKAELYFIYITAVIHLGDISKTLDLIESLSKLNVPGKEKLIEYRCTFELATCYMYQGKLEQARQYAVVAKEVAMEMDDEELAFKAEILELRAQMSGWHNIFFCVEDVKVDVSLIEKLMRYNYRNYLAHVYIYAYDNKPGVVARAYRSEAALVHFTQGIKLAKEIGNERLVCNAYQKNAMIASTNGMNEIALLYSIRTYQFIRDKLSLEAGRMFSAIGYNLSAMGHGEESAVFYGHAISIFQKLQLPEDIAEVCYNYALTCIAGEDYAMAEEALQLAVQTVDKLHLNSLRVCNLAKLYAIQSFISTMLGHRFDSERYLLRCEQFMTYILEKQDEEIVHDFARSDDDICLYHFAKAMHEMSLGDYEGAFLSFEKAEKYFERAEGNLFYIHRIYRKARKELYRIIGRVELGEVEEIDLRQYEEVLAQISETLPKELLEEVRKDAGTLNAVPTFEIKELIRQTALAKQNLQSKRQLEFISTWQHLLDQSDVRVYELVKSSIRLFLNRFGNDCALYVRYDGTTPYVLYNDTGIFFSEEKMAEMAKRLQEYPSGIAVSKISQTFFEHKDIIRLFDEDEVCSFVAVPFFKNGVLESYVVTYIKMKDNWHDSVNRYLLNEDDLRIYQLLFRELGHAIHRLESYNKIYQMNKRLQEAATTDVLTGIANRMGMYERLHDHIEQQGGASGLGVMFIDLDNFKPYNDTYGHEIGDIVLQGMAQIFKEALENKGFVSRYGGDEFIIVVYNNDRGEICDIADEIYRRIQKADGFAARIQQMLQTEVVIDKKDQISCSIGITTCESITHEDQLDDLINIADDLLYTVKEHGKGTYNFA